MLEIGEAVPEARIWLAPRQELSLRDVVEDGPVLLVFYLFDWSST